MGTRTSIVRGDLDAFESPTFGGFDDRRYSGIAPEEDFRDLVEVLIEPVDADSYEWRGRLAKFVSVLEGFEVNDSLHDYVWALVPRESLARLQTEEQISFAFDDDYRPLPVQYGVRAIWPSVSFEAQSTATAQDVAALVQMQIDGTYGQGVEWAMIDSDVRNTHLIFSSPAPIRYEVSAGSPVQVATSPFSPGTVNHGTHVAGLIKSMAPACTLHCLTLPANAVGNGIALGSTSLIVKALDWISVQSRIFGVNLSLAEKLNGGDSPWGDAPINKAVLRCLAAGKLVVVSAGNFGVNHSQKSFQPVSVSSPANCAGVLVVGASFATDPQTNGIWPSSSRGPTSDGRPAPDVVAPGVDIESADTIKDSAYTILSGTSQSAAIVSGMAAALASLRRGQSASTIRAAIIDGACTLNRDRYSEGNGQVDFSNALRLL